MWALIRRLRAAISNRFKRFVRDVRFLSGLVPALLEIRGVARSAERSEGRWSSVSFWDGAVRRYGHLPAVIFGERTFTYEEVDRLSNRCGRAALRLGMQPGKDAAAILMENRPEFIFLMLGLAKIGVQVALLNTNVTGEGLLRSIRVCGAKHVLFSQNTTKLIGTISEKEATSDLSFACIDDDPGPETSFGKGRSCGVVDFPNVSDSPIPPGLRSDVKMTDTMLHIFTSGTTGLPKAAKISHLRFFGSSLIFSRLCRFKETDRIYCPLPFYHSSAIVLGFGLCVHGGLPFISRRKFSASEFWSDCTEHRATVVQYIGELCRYLCAAPSVEDETRHSVRIALGNGLRPDVWTDFIDRFRIPRVVEFYAATEGNVGLINTEGKLGAVGFLSPLLARKHPGKILRFDYFKCEPFRDGNGRCIEALPGEVGEFVGMINKTDVTQRFDGYSDKSETDKKLLKDVFVPGDLCFRSGDLMQKDEEGFIYFVDRIGDTFRWKGENVSTTEVEGVLQSCQGVRDCAVYGVRIDGYEGKAGMAILHIVDDTADVLLCRVYAALSSGLPEYARPIFVRLRNGAVDATATFKHQKRPLVLQGFDPKSLPDDEKIFFRTAAEKRSIKADDPLNADESRTRPPFVELTSRLHEEIINGDLSL